MPWQTHKPGRSASAAGYGAAHRKRRAGWVPLVATGTVPCWRCGELIPPGARWHLGHDDHDRSITRGPEHATCNVRAASAEAHRRRWSKDPEPTPKTAW